MKEKVATKKAPRKEKVDSVNDIKDRFKRSSIVVLTEYSGLSVAQVTKLKRELRKADAEFRVYKNTLTNIAIKGGDVNDLASMLAGPNAFLFGYGDPVAPVKVLSDFIKENEKPVIKAGVFDKKFLDGAAVKALAKLPPREVLLARVVGGIASPIYGLVNVLQGTIRNLVYALVAIKDKKPQT